MHIFIFFSSLFAKRKRCKIKNQERRGENMESDTLILINEKIRELLKKDEEVAFDKAIKLIEVINNPLRVKLKRIIKNYLFNSFILLKIIS